MSNKLRNASPNALKLSQTFRPDTIENSLQLLASHTDSQIVALKTEMYLLIRVLFVVGVATASFGYAISEWARDKRDRLIVKLLRAVVLSDSDGRQVTAG